jgi:hypothetical protein
MYGSDDIAANDQPTAAPKSNAESQVSLDGEKGKEMQAIPRSCSLEGLTEISRTEGVELAKLVPFDTIAVRTVNSDYRIFVLDPETGRALLDGGGQITEPVEARIFGSSFGGSVLRPGWIGVGLRMEALVNDKYIRTSPVQSLCVAHQTSSNISQ